MLGLMYKNLLYSTMCGYLNIMKILKYRILLILINVYNIT